MKRRSFFAKLLVLPVLPKILLDKITKIEWRMIYCGSPVSNPDPLTGLYEPTLTLWEDPETLLKVQTYLLCQLCGRDDLDKKVKDTPIEDIPQLLGIDLL